MEYGLVVNWDTSTQELTLVSGNPVYKKSIAVHTLTLNTALSEGNLVEATFGTYDSLTQIYTPITEALNMGQVGLNTYSCPIPDLVVEESGNYVISFAILTPIVQNDGSLKYRVLTTGIMSFEVNASIAQVSQKPIDPTVADNLQRQINALALRVTHLEEKSVNTVLVDFTVNSVSGEGIKYYSDGTTASVQFPVGGGGGIRTDWLRILEFTENSFYQALDGSYELAFGSAATNFTNPNYISVLDRTDVKTYEVGQELAPTQRQGYSQLADTYFKGSDGSILLYGLRQPFAGRLVLLGGSAFSGEIVESIIFDNTSYPPVLKIRYISGTTTLVPLDGVPIDPNYTHTDNNFTDGEKTKLAGIQAGAQVNPVNVSAFNNDKQYQTLDEVRAAIAAVVDNAPETLDTLNELAAALGDDPNFATTVMDLIAKKANQTQVDEIQARDSVVSITYNGNTYRLTINFRYAESQTIQLPAPTVAQRYVGAYTTASWQGSAAPFTIPIPESTHGRGSNPLWKFYNNQIFDVDVTSGGDLTVYTTTKKAITVVII